MDLGKVFIDSVIVGNRHRPLDPDKVEALAESIDAIGLQQPISVYMNGDDEVFLVAGLHRLEAAKALRWEQVDASFITLSPAKREMWEIAENLFRVDLTKDQRDQHIRRYAELIEQTESENQVTQNAAPEIGYKKPPPQKKGTARKVAEETGLSVDTVRRALKPSNVTDIEKARRSRLDNDIRDRATKEAAEIIAEYVPAGAWDGLKANLYACGAKHLADAFTNITGNSLMDREGWT